MSGTGLLLGHSRKPCPATECAMCCAWGCREEIVVQLQMHGGAVNLMLNAGSLHHTPTGFKTRKA